MIYYYINCTLHFKIFKLRERTITQPESGTKKAQSNAEVLELSYKKKKKFRILSM